MLIAATSSGCGKTTFTIGLLKAFRERGMKVQPFKCGPDYIDTKFHERVCGRPSINLDTFMTSPDHVRELFNYYGADADVCVVEGMMGLFDGYDRDCGSSAEIARVLGIPVVLVVDARSAAYSTAALLQGFLHFRDDVNIAGVVFNKVGSERHRQMLQQVYDDLYLPCFGYLPKSPSLEQGSRYLGLDFSNLPPALSKAGIEGDSLSNVFEDIADHLINALPSKNCAQPTPLFKREGSGVSLLVARNAESFSFLYQENLDRFVQVTFFDPETEVPQFDGIDLFYLPGGYPEKHVEELMKNEACRNAIRDFAERGGRIVAECGGMMYLCKSIVTDNGEYPMCGVFPYTITARTCDRKLSLGYRRFVFNGNEYRGHEFHYTQFLGATPPSVTQVYDAYDNPVPTPVFHYKNVLASYTHLYHLPHLSTLNSQP